MHCGSHSPVSTSEVEDRSIHAANSSTLVSVTDLEFRDCFPHG
jgi:hypothetical protein